MRSADTNLPDTQATPDTRGIKLQKVGIRGVVFPSSFLSRDVSVKGSAYCSLSAEKKGVNMSRFVETLYQLKTLSPHTLKETLEYFNEREPSEDHYLQVTIDRWLFKRNAMITDNWGWEHVPIIIEAKRNNNRFRLFMTFRFQYHSTCPCSKNLSLHLEETGTSRGAPHQQRSFAEITMEFHPEISHFMFFERVLSLLEEAVKVVPFPFVKREDEQEAARRSWENPMFSEDAAREIALVIDSLKEVIDYSVVVDHEESIHSHNAVAIVWKGIPNGLR